MPESPLQVKRLAARHGFSFHKHLGQNFLADRAVVDGLVSDVEPDERILEIGCGFGALTRAVADRGGRVIAVEIDRSLAPVLQETLDGCAHAHVLFEDAMKADLPAIVKKHLGDGPLRVMANLPYGITTPLILRLLGSGLPLAALRLMMQKEVADKLLSAPGDDGWGSLSVAVRYYGSASLRRVIAPQAFWPRPHVDSAVVDIAVHEAPCVNVPAEPFFQMVNAAMAMRRKTLANNLAAFYGMSKENALRWVERAGLDGLVRGETLSLQALGRLYHAKNFEKNDL